MADKDYRIFINDHDEPIITVPLRMKQLDLLKDLLVDEIEYLRDDYTEENREVNLPTQNELVRIKKKILFASKKLNEFKTTGKWTPRHG